MLIKKWKIRIQSDGRPAITFPSGRQDGVLLPEAEDIELSDEGLIFSISRRGKIKLISIFDCCFNTNSFLNCIASRFVAKPRLCFLLVFP